MSKSRAKLDSKQPGLYGAARAFENLGAVIPHDDGDGFHSLR